MLHAHEAVESGLLAHSATAHDDTVAPRVKSSHSPIIVSLDQPLRHHMSSALVVPPVAPRLNLPHARVSAPPQRQVERGDKERR